MRKRILNNRIEIPSVGLGIFNIKDAEELENALKFALDAGYRSLTQHRCTEMNSLSDKP